MSTSKTKLTPSQASIDMYIGAVFDAEIYLELERQLFKVEPRPIPRPGQSATYSREEKTMIENVIDSTRNFSYWLDGILKAPFKVFSSNRTSVSTSPEKEGSKTPKVHPRQEITPPPGVFRPRTLEAKHCSRLELNERVVNNETKSDVEEVTLAGKLPVIRHGHVKNHIKLYEDLSDLTCESSVKEPKRIGSLPKPSMVDMQRHGKKVSVGIVIQQNVEPRSCVSEKKGNNNAVRKPAKVPITPSVIEQHRTGCSSDNSGRRVIYNKEKKISTSGDGNNCRGSGGTRNNVGSVGSARKTVWLTFCGLRRDRNFRE